MIAMMARPQSLADKRRRPHSTRFRDRVAAGCVLADRLAEYRGSPRTIVLGLSSGGMPAAAAVACALELPLDVLLTSALRAPGLCHVSMGAIAEDGDAHLNPAVLWGTGAPRDYIAGEVARQAVVLADARRRLRGGRPLKLPPHATVILVADGLGTGTTAMAAIRALRERGVRRLVLGAPVAPAGTIDRLRDAVDELVVLETPLTFRTLSAFYDNFRTVSDAEVRRLLAMNALQADRPTPSRE